MTHRRQCCCGGTKVCCDCVSWKLTVTKVSASPDPPEFDGWVGVYTGIPTTIIDAGRCDVSKQLGVSFHETESIEFYAGHVTESSTSWYDGTGYWAGPMPPFTEISPGSCVVEYDATWNHYPYNPPADQTVTFHFKWECEEWPA